MTLLTNIFTFIFGAVLGSFFNVCIYRIPHGKSLVSPPSSCPKCGRRLGTLELIPIISFLMLAGRCRGCKAPIAWRYPLVEILTGLLFLAVVLKFGLTWIAVKALVFVSLLVILAFIDLDLQILPNVLTVPGIIAGLILSYPAILESVLGLAVGFLIIFLVVLLSRGGMGMGDAKLLGMIGAFYGWKTAVCTLFLGSLFGSVVGIILMLTKRIGRKTPIPFGPYLCLGALIPLFFEPVLKLFPW